LTNGSNGRDANSITQVYYYYWYINLKLSGAAVRYIDDRGSQ
jgi:hypothetical protein